MILNPFKRAIRFFRGLRFLSKPHSSIKFSSLVQNVTSEESSVITTRNDRMMTIRSAVPIGRFFKTLLDDEVLFKMEVHISYLYLNV